MMLEVKMNIFGLLLLLLLQGRRIMARPENNNIDLRDIFQDQCDSGQCIPETRPCDGQPECQDASDENDGTTSCTEHQFTCRDGRCIPDSWKCDGDPDCLDGSDERDCDECARGLFRCGEGICIGRHRTCDGSNDCTDGSDENPLFCQMHDSPGCSQHQMDCGVHGLDGINICVPREARCNSTSECPGGEDEQDCDHCRRSEFTCHIDGQCIPMRWLCDGDSDCEDSSDELNCQVVPTSSKADEGISGNISNAVSIRSSVEMVTITKETEEEGTKSLFETLATIFSGSGRNDAMEIAIHNLTMELKSVKEDLKILKDTSSLLSSKLDNLDDIRKHQAIGCTIIGSGRQCLKFHRDVLTWHSAETACNSNGGRLAVLADPHGTLAYIVQTYGEGTFFWAGGSDINQEGKWTWITGHQFRADFPWGRDEPNNNYIGSVENCLMLNYSANKGYNDAPCSWNMGYICEYL